MNPMSNFRTLIVSTCCLILASLVPQAASAQSEGWVFIGDQGNADSQAVWQHLKAELKLDDNQLLEVDFPEGEELSRSAWEDTIRPQLAEEIAKRNAAQPVTRIVTLYGTPLSVGAWEDDRETGPWGQYYRSALEQRVQQYHQALNALADAVDIPFGSVDVDESIEEFRSAFDSFATQAQQALSKVPEASQAAARTQLQTTVQNVAGVGPFLGSLRRDAMNGNTRAQQQLNLLTTRSETFNNAALLLERIPATFGREAYAANLLQENGGLLAVIGWLKQQIKMVEDNESAASLDSELAVVLWDDYRRLGTVPNLRHPLLMASGLNSVYPTLEVRRIDGTSVDNAKELVDRYVAALAAVKGGKKLDEGKVYVDLRDLPENATDSKQARLEQWLQNVAQQMEKSPGVEVTVEDSSRLFEESACPDAMLYVGWYQLGKAVDSFTFAPGGVAYHLVPRDALGIHDAQDTGWCRYFLENGATNVIGSVTEVEPLDFQSQNDRIYFHCPVLSSGVVVFGL